jgi:hypothetical protein
VIAAEIVDDQEAALAEFEALASALVARGDKARTALEAVQDRP